MITVILIGIPAIIRAGYIHFKRSIWFDSEANISIESNPHAKRQLLNSEVIIVAYLFFNDFMMKILKNEKFTDEWIKKLLKYKKIKNHFKKRTILDSTFDLE